MLLEPARQGLRKTLITTLVLAKIIMPITILIVALEKLDLLSALARFFGSFLHIFGLPGEASLPLILGTFINVYAAMGAIVILKLSPREITILAMIILTGHSLPMEAPVLSFTGLSPWRSIVLRIGCGLFLGFITNLFYLGLEVIF